MSGGLTIHAVLRPRDNQGAGAIRVWVGLFGEAEDFTLDEARAICRAGDRALGLDAGDFGRGPCKLAREGLCEIDLADDASGRFDAEICSMVVRRDWLVALLRALRTALHTDAAAREMAA